MVVVSDLSARINARLDGHDHREWCRLNADVADAPVEVRLLTETIRQVTGMTLGIVEGNEALAAIAKRFRPAAPSQPMDGSAEQ